MTDHMIWENFGGNTLGLSTVQLVSILRPQKRGRYHGLAISWAEETHLKYI